MVTGENLWLLKNMKQKKVLSETLGFAYDFERKFMFQFIFVESKNYQLQITLMVRHQLHKLQLLATVDKNKIDDG